MARRKQAELSLSKVRSALTNGSTVVLGDVDARSAWMRRLRDLIQLHLSDLGGRDNVTQAELVLVRRAAMMTLQLEMMERNWAVRSEGEATTKQIEVYQRLVGALRRTLETLGLERRSKNITPDLQTYLRQRTQENDDIIDAEAAE
jgi:hypothetical protein